MQIVCDQCGKKYKTREKKTKPFKIRCTQCPNVFIVDPSKMQDDEATRQVSKEMAESLLTGGKPPQQAETPAWYAVVQEQQAGPFTVTQLKEMWAQGQVSAQTYVWKDGMGGWELITSVPDLSAVSQASAPSPDPQAQQREAQQLEAQQREAQQREAQQREAQQREAQQREAQQREAQQREAQQREAQQLQMREQVEVQHSPSLVVNKMTSPKPEANLLSSSSSPELEQRQPSSVLTTAQLKNQRNDNSVLFSLDSIEGLTASSEPSAPQAKPASVTNTGGTEGSGLIDISALGSSFGSTASASDANGKATINLTAGMKKPPMMSKQRSNLPLILASVLLTTLASGAGFYFFVFKPQQQAAQLAAIQAAKLAEQEAQRLQASAAVQPATSVTTPEATTQGAAQGTVQAAAQAVVATNETSIAAETPDPQPKPAVKPAPKKPRSSSRRRRSRRASRRSSKPKPKPKPKPTTKKSGEASSLLSGLHGKKKDLPAKPSKGSIVGAMKKVNVKRCSSYDPSLKGKKVFVQIKIGSSGRVQSATSLPPVRGTTTGSCLEREVRKQKVPPFKDKDVSFKFPFQLR